MPVGTKLQDSLYLDAVKEYGAAITRLAGGYEANAERRNDLLQDIHIALWKSFAGFDGQCSVRTRKRRALEKRNPRLRGLRPGFEVATEF